MERADLRNANLQQSDLRGIKGLTALECSSKKNFISYLRCLFVPTGNELKETRNWVLAYHSQEHFNALGLPSDHNERIAKKELNGYALRGINLQDADFEGFNLADANLQEADLRAAKGLSKGQLQAARNWVLAYYGDDVVKTLGLPPDHNERIARKDVSGYLLRDANLRGADLDGFNLADANLQGADLRAAKGLVTERLLGSRNWALALYSADLLTALGLPPDHNVRLNNKDLSGYSLPDANFRVARLRGFNLRGADLHNADMRYADLEGAELLWANLRKANLQGANLRGVKGLTGTICSLKDGLWLFLKCLVIDPQSELLAAKNWILAFYSRDLLDVLGLPSDHNKRIRAKNLSGYRLQNISLEGADLNGMIGLTRDQLGSAIKDDMTQFPDYLQPSKPQDMDRK